MASLAEFKSKRKNGKPAKRYEIWVTLTGGKRLPIRLGNMTKHDAEAVAIRVQRLVNAHNSGLPIDNATAQWLGECSDKLAARLAKLGLAAPRPKSAAAPTLAAWIDAYLAGHTMKPRTKLNFGQVRGWLLDYFGAEKRLDVISPGDADDWRRWLATQGRQKLNLPAGGQTTKKLGKNTIRKHCQRASQIFRAAERKKLIAENPFAEMRDLTMHVSEDRDHFVTSAEAQQVLAACADNQWRLLFALARYGGLRIPSEARELRWADVDLESGRMVVRSPKTEHHDGKGSRIVPIFPELRPHLQAALNDALAAADGANQGQPLGFCVTLDSLRRDKYANPRTQMERIVERAGVAPWPKLFHNCRASRETELCDSFPEHVALAWIGNSKKVARRHYLRPTETHFAAAIGAAPPAQPVASSQPAASDALPSEKGVAKTIAKSVAPSAEKALHNPLQPVAAPHGHRRQKSKNPGKTNDLPPPTSTSVHDCQNVQYPGQDSNL